MYFFIFILFRIDIRFSKQQDPDQAPQNADLGLHCLPVSQKWDARLIWVKDRSMQKSNFTAFIVHALNCY